MPQTIILCPYVGLNDDPSVRLSYADGRHRCYALPEESAFAPDSEHQLRYCLASGHTGCSRYRPAAGRRRHRCADATTVAFATFSAAGCSVGVAGHHCTGSRVAVGSDCDGCRTCRLRPLRLSSRWRLLRQRRSDRPPSRRRTRSLRRLPSRLRRSLRWAFIAQQRIEEIPTPTLAAGEVFLAVTPQAEAVGWVTSGEARGNHLGDSYLYTGIYTDELFHGVMQFDLSRVACGAADPLRPRCC